MPVQKQQVSVNFQKGLDTKSDPWQVPIGNFLELENSVFTKQGLLQKRNGFSEIASINDSSVCHLSTFKGELTAIGSSLYAFNDSSNSFINKGTYYNAGLTTQSFLSNNTDIQQCDSVSAPNGTTCVVWYQLQNPITLTYSFKFAVFNTETGQNLILPTDITPNGGVVSGVPKVFYLNNNFVVIFPRELAGNQSLQYFAINSNTLAVTASATVAPSYTPNPAFPFYFSNLRGLSWDAVSVNNRIYVGYNQGAGGFYCNYIAVNLAVSTPVQIDAANTPSCVGAMSDGTNAYFAYYDYLTGLGSIVGISGLAPGVSTLWAPAAFFNLSLITGENRNIPNITGSIVGSTITVFYEQNNVYSYIPDTTFSGSIVIGSGAYSNRIYKRTCTTAGVPGVAPANPFTRGVGLASKSFVVNNQIFFTSGYSVGSTILGGVNIPTYQPCYFVQSDSGQVVTQFSYRNGAGYNPFGLPNVSVISFTGTTTLNSNIINSIADTSTLKVGDKLISQNFPFNNLYITEIISISSIAVSRSATVAGATTLFNTTIKIPYLYQSVIQGFQGSSESNSLAFGLKAVGIASLELFKSTLKTAEAGNNLNLTGGFLWNYDGTYATENNFFLSPDTVYAQASPEFFKTASTTNGAYAITVNNVTGIELWQVITGSGIPSNTQISGINAATLTLTLTNPANATAAGVAVKIGGGIPTGTYFYQAIYQYTDNQGNMINSGASVPVKYEVYPTTNFTATLTLGSDILSNCSSLNNLQLGQLISGTGIIQGSFISNIDSSNPSNLRIKISNIITVPGVGVALTATKVSQVNVSLPTLRLTYKPSANINIYRTGSDGVAEQVNIFPIINDSSVDSITFRDIFAESGLLYSLQGKPVIYTTGGVLDNSTTPACNDLAIFDNRLWVLNSETPKKLFFSKPILEKTPVEMSDLQTIYVSDLQNPQADMTGITALAVMDDKIIMFKKNSIYYLNGIGPDATGANSQYSEPVLITGTVGCINPNSTTFNPMGIVFQSDKGIWLLGRDLQTNYFGAPVESFTQNALVSSAQLIPATNQSRIMLNSGIMLMYDYFFGQWGTFTGINNISSTIYEGLHTLLDQYGRIIQETPNEYLDISNPVLMKFKTNWFALAGIQGFQRAYFLFLLGKYYSPHKLNVELFYDFNDGISQSTLITPDNYASVYGADPFFGSNEFFGGPSQVEKWRIMFERQKCDSVQLKVTEIYDPSFGVTAGQGLTLSGMNFIIGVKKGYGPISQFNTAG